MFTILTPYQALIDIGPVQMSVRAEKKGKPIGREWRRLEKVVNHWLEDVTRNLMEARKPWPQALNVDSGPKILRTMHGAVQTTGEMTLTSMAAVAGSMSELVCKFLAETGASKVLVNNGGDIAIHLDRGEHTRVGIVPRLGAQPSHFLEVASSGKVRGIATSGLGGRSFTRGIADAAVAIATKASIADACATILGNEVMVDSPLVQQRLAVKIDPATDIPDLLVTTAVNPLPTHLRDMALEWGLHKARQLVEAKLLIGAVLFLQGEMRQIPDGIAQALE